jgi:hypothetical protein
MPLDWRAYERFPWATARQSPMNAAEREAIEHWAAALLGIADRSSSWGVASPPGRFAATVVRLARGAAHRPPIDDAGVGAIGLKIFKDNRDANRESARLVEFHRHQISRLPGLPHPGVQRSLSAGRYTDDRALTRRYVLQEWVQGETLEALIRDPAHAPLSGDECRAILTQLFLSIVGPLWLAGTVWWDIRDANFCFDREGARLRLIDVDSLASYADEILETPHDWTRREKGRKTALARLRRMSLRVLEACPSRGASAARAFDNAWPRIESVLVALGLEERDPASLSRMLAGEVERGLRP